MQQEYTIPLSEQPSKRIAWIDCTRIFAALLVVMVHTPVNTSFDYMDAVFISSHVPCFYFLSGLFIKKTDWKHILQRILFLLIPYILWNNIAFFLQHESIFQNLSTDDFGQTVNLYFHQIILSPADIPFWFLRNLIFYTLLIPFFSAHPKTSFTAVIVLIVMAQASEYFDAIHFGRNVNGLIFFLLGMMMSRHKTTLTQGIRSYGAPILIATVLLSGLAMRYHDIINITGQLVAICGLMSLGMAMTHYLPSLSRKFATMAESCFLLYAIHYPIILICGWKESMYLPWWNYGYSFIFAIACLCLSYVLYIGMRKYTPKILRFVAAVKS